MRENYFTIKQNGQYETEVKKSQFICSLKRIYTEFEAKEFIAKKKKEHWKASHNCSAFIIEGNESIQRSSDDGEPSGTAGIPILEVLKKQELVNVVAVVTRYFGGTKLGAGGLIRAYGHAVADAINHVGVVEGKLQQELQLTFAYTNLGKVQNFMDHYSLIVKEITYAEQVTLTCLVDGLKIEQFILAVTDLLNGSVLIKKGASSYNEIPVSRDH